MKRFCLCISLLISISITSRVGAEPKDGQKTDTADEVFQPQRLWHLAELPAWWFGWMVVHEGTHALAAKYWEWDIDAFRPYPHQSRYDANDAWDFHWGAVYLKCSQKDGLHWDGSRYVDGLYWPMCEDDSGLAAISLAPYVLDASVFAISDLALSYGVDPDSTTGAVLYMGGMVGPWVNAFFGSDFLTGGADLATFSERTGSPKWATLLAFDTAMAIGAWRLYVQGKAVFYDRSKKEETGFVLAPFSAGDARGLSLGMKW